MHYTSQKMVQHRYDPSEPDMPHWCIALVPDDDSATVTFLRGKDAQRLTLAEAEKRVATLNEKLMDH